MRSVCASRTRVSPLFLPDLLLGSFLSKNHWALFMFTKLSLKSSPCLKLTISRYLQDEKSFLSSEKLSDNQRQSIRLQFGRLICSYYVGILYHGKSPLHSTWPLQRRLTKFFRRCHLWSIRSQMLSVKVDRNPILSIRDSVNRGPTNQTTAILLWPAIKEVCCSKNRKKILLIATHCISSWLRQNRWSLNEP